MNWNLLVKRILRRPTCTCEKGVVIHRKARISNCAGDSAAIHVGAYSHIKGELLTFGHGGEIQLTDAMKLLLESQELYGMIFRGDRYDIGNKLDWFKANIELTLKRDEFREPMIEHIKRLLDE